MNRHELERREEAGDGHTTMFKRVLRDISIPKHLRGALTALSTPCSHVMLCHVQYVLAMKSYSSVYRYAMPAYCSGFQNMVLLAGILCNSMGLALLMTI